MVARTKSECKDKNQLGITTTKTSRFLMLNNSNTSRPKENNLVKDHKIITAVEANLAADYLIIQIRLQVAVLA